MLNQSINHCIRNVITSKYYKNCVAMKRWEGIETTCRSHYQSITNLEEYVEMRRLCNEKYRKLA